MGVESREGSWRSGTSDDLAGSPGALGLYFLFPVPGSDLSFEPKFLLSLMHITHTKC